VKRAAVEGAQQVVHCKRVIPGRELLSCGDGPAENWQPMSTSQAAGSAGEPACDFGASCPLQHPSLLICSGALQSRVVHLRNPRTAAP